MSARDVILAAVRRNLPRPEVALPTDPSVGRQGITCCLGYKEQFTGMPEIKHSHNLDESLVSNFKKQLEGMGGRWFDVADAAAAQAKVAELFLSAKVICSAVSEVPGNRRVENVSDPHDLNDVDVGIVRSPLAVAEAGAVWLTQTELVVNALGVWRNTWSYCSTLRRSLKQCTTPTGGSI